MLGKSLVLVRVGLWGRKGQLEHVRKIVRLPAITAKLGFDSKCVYTVD